MKKLLLALMISAFAFPAFADDAAKNEHHGDHEHMMKNMDPAQRKEMRKKMADMHRKMADCLDSDKDMKTCHEEMEKNMKDAGMDMSKMHHMHHGDHGAAEAPKTDADKK